MVYINKILDFLGKLVIISAGVITGLFAFIDSFKIKVNVGAVICIPIIFSAIFLLLVMSRKKIKNIFISAIAILIVIFVVVNIKAFLNGIYSTVNSILEVYMYYYEKDSVGMYELAECRGIFTTETQFNTLFFVILSIAYSYILVLATSNRFCTTIHIALSATFLFPGMILGEFPGIAVVSIMITYYFACFMFKNNSRIYFGRLVFLSVITMVTIGIMMLIISPREYYDSDIFAKNKKKIDRIISSIDIDTIFRNLSDFVLDRDMKLALNFGNKGNVGGISEGRLGEFDSIGFKKIDMLKVTISSEFSGKLYLKGYVSNEYEGNHWENLSKKHIEQYIDNRRLITFPMDNDKYKEMKKENISIEYKKADNKYLYAPYLNNIPKTECFYDLYARSYGDKKYSCKFILYVENDYLEMSLNGGEYSEEWLFYQDISMEVPYEVKEVFDEILVNPVYFDRTPEGLMDTIEYVRNYLDKNTKYSLSPGELKKGDDFVIDFLTKKKKGYCTAYASSAVLMFRYLGIPARYAEGYLATAEDYSSGKASGENKITFTIKDDCAHAWPEIYINNVGFMPVEVTPAYIGGENSGDSHNTETSNNTTTSKDIEGTSSEQLTSESETDDTTSDTETVSNSTETTKEQHTTSGDKPSRHSGNSETEIDNSADNSLDNSGNNVILIIGVLIFFILLSVVIYKAVEKSSRKNHMTDDFRYNINYMADIFVKVLLKLNIELYMDSNISEVGGEINSIILKSFESGKLDKCEYIVKEDAVEILDIIYKAKYSGENIQLSKEECEKVRQYVEEFKNSLQYLKNRV